MAGGWGGLRNPPGGRPPGSGDPWKKVLREENEAAREARRKLTEKIVGTNADPLVIMAQIGADRSEPALVRLAAARALAPYIYPAQPSESHVTHTSISADELRQTLMARLDALAAASNAPIIDATPEPLPAPEPVAAE